MSLVIGCLWKIQVSQEPGCHSKSQHKMVLLLKEKRREHKKGNFLVGRKKLTYAKEKSSEKLDLLGLGLWTKKGCCHKS